jgi:hypothetical protein
LSGFIEECFSNNFTGFVTVRMCYSGVGMASFECCSDVFSIGVEFGSPVEQLSNQFGALANDEVNYFFIVYSTACAESIFDVRFEGVSFSDYRSDTPLRFP